MRILDSMTIVANKDEVLTTLRKNREDHEAIVAEARVSYIEKARAALNAKLDALASKEAFKVRLDFTLQPPTSYIKVYNVAIRMLEMHTGDTIALDSDQVKNLIMDKWDWQEHFLAQTIGLSSNAVTKRAMLYGDE